MKEDKEGERMPKDDSPDENGGFHVDRCLQDWCRDQLEILGEEAEAAAIQRRAEQKRIGLIGSEQVTMCSCRCNRRQEDIDVPVQQLCKCIDNDIRTEIAPIP
jgi:hypothetical protein